MTDQTIAGKTFPIMQMPGYCKDGTTVAQAQQAGMHVIVVALPWDMIMEHEKQAIKNHSQTIHRLWERGGLCAEEALAVLEDRDFYPAPGDAVAHARLFDLLQQRRGVARRIEVDIGKAVAMLEESPELCAALNDLVGAPAQAEIECPICEKIRSNGPLSRSTMTR